MLYQLHRQFHSENDRLEMVAQKEINNHKEMKEWTKSIQEEFPLPEGAIWMCCDEDSEQFVWAVEDVEIT